MHKNISFFTNTLALSVQICKQCVQYTEFLFCKRALRLTSLP